MNTKLSGLSAVVLGLVAAARPAAAQLAATPVYFSPKQPTGLTVALDFGTTLQHKEGGLTQTDKPNNIGGRLALGLPVVTIGVGAGLYNADLAGLDKEVQFMGSAALKVFSPPLVPVGISLQAGAGYLKQDLGTTSLKTVTVPIGLGVAVKPMTPGMSFEAWAAPRVQFNAVSVTGSSRVQAGIGASGGLNLGAPTGLGLHLAADWSRLSAKASAGTGSLTLPETQMLIFGVGLHYTFTIPGIPIAPVI